MKTLCKIQLCVIFRPTADKLSLDLFVVALQSADRSMV